MPAELTRDAHRARLERNGNPPWMVAEILRAWFPDTTPAAPKTTRRIPPEAGVQLALDLDT
jgi:hypothetical protein